jgi:hypothetical protein
MHMLKYMFTKRKIQKKINTYAHVKIYVRKKNQ